MKYISNHQRTNIQKTLQQSHFKCNLQKLISSRLEAAPISEGICPVNWFVPNHSDPFHIQPPPVCAKRENERKKWIQLALDIIINDWINSRKSNTFNAFALPISEAYLDSTPRVWVIQTDSVAMYRLIYCHLKNWSTKSVKVPEKEYQHINWMTTLT